MKVYKLVSKKKVALVWLVTGVALCTLLIFPTECRNGATNGIFLSIQVLIPSMLPFIILSSFMVNSGIVCCIPVFLGKICKAVFGLPAESLGVILLSLIGGYPVGASGIKALYQKEYINLKQAQRMSLFCVSAGPGFLVTYIGAAMTRNLRAGYILLASQIISVLILGIISRFFENHTDEKVTVKKKNRLNVKEALVNSVNESIYSALKISTLVILFGALSEIFIVFTLGHPKLTPLVALLEITNGIKESADRYPLTLISFLCGFGGLCVHLQIFSQLESINISKSLFLIFRSAQAILCGLFTEILLQFFPVTQEVISTVRSAKPIAKSGIVGCIFLLATCLCFIISVRSLKLTDGKCKT